MKFPSLSFSLLLLLCVSCKRDDLSPGSAANGQNKAVTVSELNLITSFHLPDHTTSGDLKLWESTADAGINPVYLSSDSTIIPSKLALPWRAPESATGRSVLELKAEDGWTLVFKSFGSSIQGVKFPFFAVLNSQTKELRFYINNAGGISASSFKGDLMLKDGQKMSASKSASSTSQSSWIRLDFSMPKYALTDIKAHAMQLKLYQQVDYTYTPVQ